MQAIDIGTKIDDQSDGQRSTAILVYENEGCGIITLWVDGHTD
jgi:hypothetical protein